MIGYDAAPTPSINPPIQSFHVEPPSNSSPASRGTSFPMPLLEAAQARHCLERANTLTHGCTSCPAPPTHCLTCFANSLRFDRVPWAGTLRQHLPPSSGPSAAKGWQNSDPKPSLPPLPSSAVHPTPCMTSPRTPRPAPLAPLPAAGTPRQAPHRASRSLPLR